MSGYNNNSACSFATLSNYNSRSNGSMNKVGEQMNTVDTSGVYIVPNYGAPGYDTLASGTGGCSGYRNIVSAYGEGANKCSQEYLKKICM